MTHYIIIEDERFAYEELKRMMRRLRPEYELIGWAQSVEQAVLLLERGSAGLVIADIRLADGLCFDVFGRFHTDIPVIFTTAYDEYALKAFRLNSIDYLLKPVEEKDLERALDKFERNRLVRPTSESYSGLERMYMSGTRKNRFLVRIGDEFRHVETDEVACFNSEDKAVYMNLFSGKRYVIDYSLDSLEPMLDSMMFFRVSRGCIANIKAIQKVTRFFGSRLRVELKPQCCDRLLVSRVRTADFLKWLGGDSEK